MHSTSANLSKQKEGKASCAIFDGTVALTSNLDCPLSSAWAPALVRSQLINVSVEMPVCDPRPALPPRGLPLALERCVQGCQETRRLTITVRPLRQFVICFCFKPEGTAGLCQAEVLCHSARDCIDRINEAHQGNITTNKPVQSHEGCSIQSKENGLAKTYASISRSNTGCGQLEVLLVATSWCV